MDWGSIRALNATVLEFNAVLCGILVLEVFGLYHLQKSAGRRQALFVILIIAVPFMMPAVYDLLAGSHITSAGRYYSPGLLGVYILIAYMLAGDQEFRWRRLRKAGMAFLIACGLASCIVMLPAKTWWNKKPDNVVRVAAEVINGSDRPLLIAPLDASLFALSHELDPTVDVLGMSPENPMRIPAQYSDVFVYGPSDRMVRALKERYGYRLKVSGRIEKLWLLEPDRLNPKKHYADRKYNPGFDKCPWHRIGLRLL